MLMTSTRFTSLSGYHEEKSSFGVMKKGIYKPSSDFNFDFVAEVLCANPYNSGYLVTVTYERSHACDNTESTRYFSYWTVHSTNLHGTLLRICTTKIFTLTPKTRLMDLFLQVTIQVYFPTVVV